MDTGPQAGRLSWKTRLGYGLGDMGFNLFFTTASLFLLFFYTDVAGLAPSTAGWIMAAALVWDAVTDPAMGFLASRSRSRFGRYRPWILFGTVPLAISFTLIFLPVGFSGAALAAWALAAHLLFRSCYTIVSMPYVSLSAAMTTNADERSLLAAIRMLAATSAGLGIAIGTLPLVAYLGQGDEAVGFFRVALLYAGAATLLMLLIFMTSHEDPAANAAPLPSLADMLRMLRANRAFWLVSGSMLMAASASTFFGKTIPYHLKYDGARETLIGPALATMTGCAFLTIPLWTLLMRRTSKRLVSLVGTSLAILGYIAFHFAHGFGQMPFFASLALLGAAAGAGYLSFWAMLPDTVEYGEWRTAVRAEGIIFGFVSFVQKAALGLSVGLLGELLSVIGYVANQPQDPQTLEDMRALMLWAPALLSVVGAGFIFAYPLDRATHARIVSEIADRQTSDCKSDR